MPKPNCLLSLFLSFCLILEQSVFAQTIDLSHYFAHNSGQTIPQADKFRPLHLRYISYDSQANDFKLLLDKGDFFNQKTSESLNSQTPELENATQELMKYFFIGLALPNEKFWVNLRPDSPDNILDPDLEKTDIGKIFLEADLQLKKDTSGMTSPQTKEGKEYWDKLYKKAGELFSSENITIPTLTRPWIVPDEVIIRESPEGAYIYKATLKVMLEEDYLTSRGGSRTAPTYQQYTFSDPRLKELNEYSTQLIKETIIPKLTRQINTSKRYAPLRQVYYSLILAQWFKARYRSQRTENREQNTEKANNCIDLIDSGNLTSNFKPLTSQSPYSKETYFQQYQKSFKDGEYNLREPIHTPMVQSIRRYMSGGMRIDCSSPIKKDIIPAQSALLPISDHVLLSKINPRENSHIFASSTLKDNNADKNKKLQDSAFYLARYFTKKYPQINKRNKLVYYLGGSLSVMLLSQADEVEILEQGNQPFLARQKIPISLSVKKKLRNFVRKIKDIDYFYYPLDKGENQAKDFETSLIELPDEAKKVVQNSEFHSEGDFIQDGGNPARVSVNGEQFYIVEPLEMFHYLAHEFLYVRTDSPRKMKRAIDLNNLVSAIEDIYCREVIIKVFHTRWFHEGWKYIRSPEEKLSNELIGLFDAIARFDNGEYIDRLTMRPRWQDALKINYIVERLNNPVSKNKVIKFLNKNSNLIQDYFGYLILCSLNENNIEVRLVVLEKLLQYDEISIASLVKTFGHHASILIENSFSQWTKYRNDVELLYSFLARAIKELKEAEFKSLLSELNIATNASEKGLQISNSITGGRSLGSYRVYLIGIAEKYNIEILSANSAAENTEASSSLLNKKGGIDLSRINKSIRTESVSSPGAGGLNSPVDADFDLNEELGRLQNMLNAEIIPSASRLDRYARAARAGSASSPDSADSAISLVAETFRLQEEKSVPAPAELKTLAAWLEQGA